MIQTNNRSWFRAGEFARLCGVSKHTLVHYDEIGVVRSARNEENGYRYYSLEQFYQMDIVMTLQAAGMTLSEIRQYMEGSDPEGFLVLLEEKQMCLAKEQEKLSRMQRVLKSAAARTREGLQACCGVPRIEYWGEQPLIITPLQGEDDRAQMEACSDHFEYCYSRGIGQELPIGVMVTCEHLLAREFNRWDYYFNPIPRARKCSRLFVRPAGEYAIIEERTSYEKVNIAYEKLYDFLARENRQIIGNSYEQDLISYMATHEPDQYIIRVAIQVGQREA